MTDEARSKANAASKRWYHSHLEQAREKSRRSAAAWRKKNPERWKQLDKESRDRRRDKIREYFKRYKVEHPDYPHRCYLAFKAAHPERIKEWGKRWCSANKDKRQASARRLRASNPERSRERDRAKRARNPDGPLLRSIVFRMLIGQRKIHRSSYYVGCNAIFLRNHLESQFKPGMTWQNHGPVWHVDHIGPLSWWDVKNHPEHLEFASHYSNLQPLWGEENMSKGARKCA